MNSEVWRAVVGYEGVYEVSSLGRIKRIAPACHTRPGRIVNPGPYGNGKKYLRVSLSVNNKVKSLAVHKIVAEAFLGPRPAGMTVNHIDLHPTNNTASNLEYVTMPANYWHARKKGKMGVTIPQETVDLVRANSHLSNSTLMAMFGLCSATVSRIVNGKTRTIPEPEDYRNAEA